jgi:uncharacterized peroxidase-related enzyme
MDERRFELVTVVAASCVNCSVCTIQHGARLLASDFTPEQVEAVSSNHRAAGLSDVDQAIAAFAELVALQADQITQDDVDKLRSFGLDDGEIFDIVLAVSYRLGWSRANDAIGYEPSVPFLQRSSAVLGPDVFNALMVGRQYDVPSS